MKFMILVKSNLEARIAATPDAQMQAQMRCPNPMPVASEIEIRAIG